MADFSVSTKGEQPAPLLRRQAAWRGLAVALGRFDAFELAHRVGAEGLVQHGLLQHASHDRPDGAPGVGRIPHLLGGGAVGVRDGASGLLQPAEEGIDVRDVALLQLEPAEFG